MNSKDLAKARADVYKFFANLILEEPSSLLLEKFSDKAFISSLSDIFEDKIGSDLMKNSVLKNEDLELDFSNLLIVPNERYLMPFESVYLDERNVGSKIISGLVLGESSVAVKNLYNEAGAKMNIKELPDHIGLELEFMHFLCMKESQQDKGALECLKLEKKFLDEHLLKWADKFCSNMAENSKTDFYKGFAQIMKGFIYGDIVTIQDNLRRAKDVSPIFT